MEWGISGSSFFAFPSSISIMAYWLRLTGIVWDPHRSIVEMLTIAY